MTATQVFLQEQSQMIEIIKSLRTDIEVLEVELEYTSEQITRMLAEEYTHGLTEACSEDMRIRQEIKSLQEQLNKAEFYFQEAVETAASKWKTNVYKEAGL